MSSSSGLFDSVASSTVVTAEQQQQAGEIFSSDGLPPLEPLVAPVLSSNYSHQDGDEHGCVVLDSGVDVVRAFEVFSGKLFFPGREKNNNNAVTQVRSNSSSETPLQRLARLRTEVEELEQDLAVDHQDQDTGTVLGSDVLQDLAARLAALSGNDDDNHHNGALSPNSTQADLTQLVSQQLEKLGTAQTTTTTTTTTADPTTTTHKSGVTYELYSATSSSSSSSLEERMARIERAVGNTDRATAASSVSVLKRLEQAESIVQRLDASSLDAAAARAKLIRVDLEAAAKSKAKLTNNSAGTSEDAVAISALYDQMQALEGMSDELPALVTRLTDLQRLHVQSASFGSKLDSVHRQVDQVDMTLRNLESILTRVEEGCVENVKVVEGNLKVLDEKMDKLRA